MRTLAFRRVMRAAWLSNQVVLLAAIHEPDGTVTGEIWGAGPTMLATSPAVTVNSDRRSVTLQDGTKWSGPSPGCSCNTPKTLKGFSPV